MIAAPSPPDGAENFVPGVRPLRGLLPRSRDLARWDEGASSTRRDGGVKGAGVICPVRCPTAVCEQSVREDADLADGLVGRKLVQQFGQHRRIRCPARV